MDDRKAAVLVLVVIRIAVAAAGDVGMARLLIESGADMNISNNCQDVEKKYPATASIAVSWNWHSEVAQLLIEAGADVHHRDAKGDTALERAFDRGGWGADHRKMLETAVAWFKQMRTGQEPSGWFGAISTQRAIRFGLSGDNEQSDQF